MIRWSLSIIGARAHRDRVLLAATAGMVFISTILLAAGPMYSDAMSTAGLQRRLTDAPPTEAGIEIDIRGPASALASVENTVATAVEAAEFPTAVEQRTVAESASFAFPDELGLGEKTRTVISYREGLEEAANLIEGRHPVSPGEVTAHTTTLERAGLMVGDRLTLVTPGASQDRVEVTIVGSVEPITPTDAVWWGDELSVTGSIESGGFTTLGPLWATAEGFATVLGDIDSVLGARLVPDPTGLVPQEAPALKSAATAVGAQVEPLLSEDMRMAVATGLPELLDAATDGLTVSRTTVVLIISQLTILSLYALVLAAGLLVESRAVETALLRSRGIDPRQLSLVSLLEGLLVVVPAVLVGPLVAMGLLGILENFGPLDAAGLELQPTVSSTAMGFATIAGALCLVALVGPARHQAVAYMEVRSSQGRDRRAPIWQRTGLDIALVILAVVGLWQLQRYGGPLTSGATGQLRADPTLVAAPAVALLAGAVLSLRLIPLAGKIGEKWARRSRSLAAPLGSRQVSRRPVYHTRSALLLTMATTVGLFTASFSGTWTDSQMDQASFAVPSDFVITPYFGPNGAFPSAQVAEAYGSVDGVSSVTGVITATARSDQLDEPAQLIGVRAETLGSEFALRPDLVERPLDELRTALSGEPYNTGMSLPEDVEKVVVSVSDTVTMEAGQGGPINTNPVRVRLTLRDGSGLLHSLPMRGEPVGEGRLTATLDAESDSDATSWQQARHNEAVVSADLRTEKEDIVGSLTPPVEIAGFEIEVPTPLNHQVTIHEVVAQSTGGDSQIVAAPDWETAPDSGIYRGEPTAETDRSSDDWLRVTLDSARVESGFHDTVTFRTWVPPTSTDKVLPVIATRALLADGNYVVGEEATFEIEGREVPVRFASVAEELPTLGATGRGILVDSTRLQLHSLQNAHDVMTPTNWLVSVEADADLDAVETNLRSAQFTNRDVVGTQETAEGLLNDPLALGIIGSLIIGLVAALAVAVIGLLAASVVSAQQRVGEFSLLQALGTSRREMGRILTIENGFTILGSLVTGIVLGLGLAWFALPSIAVSPSSVLVVPRPLVVIPWVTAGLLITGGLLVIALLSATITANFRHHDVAAILRLGEDV